MAYLIAKINFLKSLVEIKKDQKFNAKIIHK